MKPPVIRILLVEDSAVDAVMFRGLLTRQDASAYAVTHVRTLGEATRHLAKRETDVVVLDLGLPDGSGVDSLLRIRKARADVPVIILTVNEDEATGLTSIQEGAQDYLLKGQLQGPLLTRSIRYALERYRITKQAEEQEESREAQLQQFIEESPVPVAMLNREMRYLAASRRWKETYGSGLQDLTGLSHYEVHPGMPERWKEAHRRGLAGESLRKDRDQWVMEDGSVQWLRWAIHPWRDPHGVIGGIIISVEDISESVATEKELLFQQGLMQETGEIAKVGGWEFVVSTGKGYWTAEVARIHELEPTTETSKEIGLNFYLPESRERVEKALAETIAHAKPYDLELELLTAKGNHRWIRTIAHPVLEDGVVTRVRGSFQDITDQKRNKEALQRLAALLDTTYDAVFVWEGGGKVAFWNHAAERIYGYSKEEACGASCHQLLQTTAPEGFDKALARVSHDGRWEGELRHVKRDGTAIAVESRMVQISEGQRNYVMEITRDISEKRLLEDQLRQSQKMEAIGRLAGGIAHDFNNLLGVILGCSELIAESDNLESIKKRAVEIEKAGKRAANLTRQLLAFSRKQVLAPKTVNLNNMISDMANMLKRIVGEDVEFSVKLSQDLGNTWVDPSQVEQILLNLVVNARDAMPQGGQVVIETQNVLLDEHYARTHATIKPGPHVMLAVSDSGIGMDQETQAQIFEPFFTTKPSGTGLGLATVYGAVKQSGGHVWVYSERGKGTTFKIYMPRVDKSADAGEAHPRAESGAAKGETVFLVEDSESLRELTREFLKMEGYAVVECGSGSEALTMARGHKGPIHLLLTDVVMPRMSGRELARQLCEIHPETRVLFMSGYTANAIQHHGVLDEGVQLVAKPFTRAGLTQKVRELLDT